MHAFLDHCKLCQPKTIEPINLQASGKERRCFLSVPEFQVIGFVKHQFTDDCILYIYSLQKP